MIKPVLLGSVSLQVIKQVPRCLPNNTWVRPLKVSGGTISGKIRDYPFFMDCIKFSVLTQNSLPNYFMIETFPVPTLATEFGQ